MVLRFWVAVLVFHAGMLYVTARIASDWARRAAVPSPRWERLRDGLIFGVAALALAGAVSVGPPGDGFLTARLLCQALFGEAVLLTAWIALLHLRPGRLPRAVVATLALGVLLSAYAEAYHVGPYDLRLRRYALDRSDGNAPRGWIRILHLSDLQSDAIGPHEERALREGLAQAPDLIVFTGDYLQERVTPSRVWSRANAGDDLRELLRRVGLRAPLGVYAVQGDVDPDWPGLFDGTGVVCLQDTAARIALPGKVSLALVGLSRPTSRNRNGRVLPVVTTAPEADLRFVMGHSPDYVATLARAAVEVDLALAGHTHGGQVALPFFGPLVTLSRLPRRFAGGLNDYDGIPLCVSRGIGMERRTAPQIRFFCPPEIVVVDVTY